MIERLKLPKVQMTLALILIFLSAFRQLPFEQYIYALLVSTISCLSFDLLISYIRIKKLFIPHAAMVTGMIIALIVNPNLVWYQIAFVCFIAMALKNYIRISNRHILNPAASGLLIGGLIFNTNVSWWGASFQNLNNINLQTLLPFIILLSPLYVSAFRMRRYFGILSFLLTYFIFLFLRGTDFGFALKSTLDPTIIFFSSVMLPEPMTSPADKKLQIFYGIFVAVASFIVSLRFLSNAISFPDPLITALLLGNLIFFKK
ncbi:MAG: hypothetical protein A3C27_03820 [Candidatus Levybacteria bacterium RIFCSPHIGHO2_02_FULL_39_36]|nr:MAG: hypothetical protein UT20_C0003G0004 [Candidatus Levybacteria bacterium GW2011_GWA1_39_11]KKR24596.1 MAG: hypothetical protein UT56_C0012G0011 [Candidatus Levybacteria bacterium GW2011_GWB1_39_7]OGH15343.1 MAG: hypothetical protein A2689_02060 [Candidatus Levybacteria bacterium RIFCSPHIGHO2_01_FULL_38_96]OGH26004.1 MAG: hypothetical protein A3E68_03135 [Candidatus Levybacteria bacterium RIFCSPHIGHO2_12_FULL_39_39]OGH28846.1 MAG: hypothetical protein A3C27_03820 [Candidatus Levybacteria 